MTQESFIPVLSPGVGWYANKILKNDPFSLVRYGNGDWKLIVPNLPEWRKHRGPNPKPPSELRQMWESRLGRRAAQESFLLTPKDENYYPAVWQQPMCRSRGWLPHVKGFLSKNGLGDLTWHDGNVWRAAVEQDRMGRMVTALRSQLLPVILVGLPHLSALENYIPIERHIVTHMMLHPVDDVKRLEDELLACPHPAVFALSCAVVGKILIQRLFPVLGKESFLIDFGSTWDGYCGHPSRGYHSSLTPERVRAALEGG
jgi:hypothetical protein